VVGESPQERDAARKRLYEREEALLKRLQAGEDTPELQAELASVRGAIRRSLRQEGGGFKGNLRGDNAAAPSALHMPTPPTT
jgi:hypothetical protein